MPLERQNSLQQKALKLYVTEMALQDIDMNLLASFETTQMQELRLAHGNPGLGFYLYPNHHSVSEKFHFRVIGLHYGAAAEDWHLWLSNPLDKWAGEFWDMVEHPERAMPGAWDEEFSEIFND